ncbi:MAG TPA: hypothetical protein PKD72_04575 [Gemmatales bacterium]|nr:hypothetical protein [Gemmatales bacterium]
MNRTLKLVCATALFMHASWLMAQEPVSAFATIGRYEPLTRSGQSIQRLSDRCDDKMDRLLCCGYGTSHNKNGVVGYRATKTFLWGSSCEFFVEDCRTLPVAESNSRWRRWMNRLNGNGIDEYNTMHTSCTNCGSR